MVRRAFAVLALLAGTAGLSGCGDDESSSGDKGLSTKTIEVTIVGSDVSPNGDRIEVKVGQPIEFIVKSDRKGALHVHSEPERTLDFGSGTATLSSFTIDKPGVIEVETADTDTTVVQLEVK